jgi:hypothetical protein
MSNQDTIVDKFGKLKKSLDCVMNALTAMNVPESFAAQ